MNNWLWTPSKQIRSWLPKLQSHRGYWSDGTTENSLSAIENSVRLGYQMIEFDVRLTSDSVVILYHDETFQNEVISLMKFEYLQSKIKMTTLEEALQWLASQKNNLIKYNIELKSHYIFSGDLERRVVALIQRYKLQSHVIISSFNPFALARVRLLDSSVYRALLLTFEKHPKNKWYLKNLVLNIFCRPHVLNLYYKDWPEVKYKNWARQIPIVLWTYNERIEDLDSDVHGIISDKITP